MKYINKTTPLACKWRCLSLCGPYGIVYETFFARFEENFNEIIKINIYKSTII